MFNFLGAICYTILILWALVIGLPMYNFNVPSTFKAWFDHVARAGVTFRYTSDGPQGLLTGKTAYILGARGGVYSGTANDHQEPYIRQMLGFLGITAPEELGGAGLDDPGVRGAGGECLSCLGHDRDVADRHHRQSAAAS